MEASARQVMLTPGGTFGDFEVVRELGRGGMGAVYLVRSPTTGREYAAKVLFAELSARDGGFSRRFLREAELAMTANHPNLVKVHDVGRDPETGLCYMIMDYVGGGNLRESVLRRLAGKCGPHTVRESLEIIRPLLSALGEIGRLGAVHRDIKPDNILFDEDGTPKLSDFGVAKVSDAQVSTQLTMSNVIVGTPAYMAPEQLIGSHHVDVRADLYSLGIVLWELLSGERLNADVETPVLMARAVKGQRIPDIRTYRKKLSPRIVEFVRRLTDPKPERRFPSADSALRFLDEWRMRQERLFRRFLTGLILAGILILTLVLFFGIRWIDASRRPASVPAKANEEVGEFSVPESVD